MIDIRYTYHEANSIADWRVSFMVEYIGGFMQIEMADVPQAFLDVLLFDLFGCIHT